LACFDRVIAAAPTDYKAWYSRSKALANLNDLQEAILSLDKTLTINPNCYYAWNYRGTILIKLKRYREAIASFDQSLICKPNNPDAWYSKARCYALWGEVDLALNYLQRAIKLKPTLYRALAKIDSHFSQILPNPQLQTLLQRRN
jgi:tetratricopeptide (TPR) repeat protein